MYIYHGWCGLKEGVDELKFAQAFKGYLNKHKAAGKIADFRLTRRRLGLGPASLGEYHFMIEVENLGQLDEAFAPIAEHEGDVHASRVYLYEMLKDIQYALYCDFPEE